MLIHLNLIYLICFKFYLFILIYLVYQYMMYQSYSFLFVHKAFDDVFVYFKYNFLLVFSFDIPNDKDIKYNVKFIFAILDQKLILQYTRICIICWYDERWKFS